MQFRVIALLAAFAAAASALPFPGEDNQYHPTQDDINKHMDDTDAHGCKVLTCALILGIAPLTCIVAFVDAINPITDTACVVATLSTLVVAPVGCDHCLE